MMANSNRFTHKERNAAPLKEITSYIEMTQNKDDVSLKKFIGYRLNEKEAILKYFKEHDSETAIITCASTDYISGEKLSNSVTCFDDGEYCWTSEEVYHFKKYDLKLNDDFVRHVLSK